jgi:hypothetical protein
MTPKAVITFAMNVKGMSLTFAAYVPYRGTLGGAQQLGKLLSEPNLPFLLVDDNGHEGDSRNDSKNRDCHA